MHSYEMKMHNTHNMCTYQLGSICMKQNKSSNVMKYTHVNVPLPEQRCTSSAYTSEVDSRLTLVVVNKYFELKNSWGCRPISNYLL